MSIVQTSRMSLLILITSFDHYNAITHPQFITLCFIPIACASQSCKNIFSLLRACGWSRYMRSRAPIPASKLCSSPSPIYFLLSDNAATLSLSQPTNLSALTVRQISLLQPLAQPPSQSSPTLSSSQQHVPPLPRVHVWPAPQAGHERQPACPGRKGHG